MGEERKTFEEGLARRRDEKRRLEAESKKAEDDRRSREAVAATPEEKKAQEVVRKQDEDKRKVESEAREKADALRRRREEYNKMSDGERAVRQQQATLSVLRVLQKLSNPNVEAFEALKKELAEVLVADLPETGLQEIILKAEADRVLKYAETFVEQIRQQQRQWDEMRVEQLKVSSEKEKTARSLLEELEKLVIAAEKASEAATATASPLAADDAEPCKIVNMIKSVEEAGRSAMALCSACADFLAQKRPEIDEAEAIKDQTAQVIAAAQPRVQAATLSAAAALQQAKSSKESCEKQLAALKWMSDRELLFHKFDADGDCHWSREDVRDYAIEVFKFQLPDENLERIFSQLVSDGQFGVRLDQFQTLKTAVGIAKHEVTSKAAKAVRETRAKNMSFHEKRESLTKEFKSLMGLLNDFESKVQAAEHSSESLAVEAGTLALDKLKAKSTGVDASVHAARTELAGLQVRARRLLQEVREAGAMAETMRPAVARAASKARLTDLRLQQAAFMAANGKQLSHHKAFGEYEVLRLEIAQALRAQAESRGTKVEHLFEVVGKVGSGVVTAEDITAFLKDSRLDTGKVDKMIQSATDAVVDEAPEMACGIDPGNPGHFDRESFDRLLRLRYKVVRDIVFSDGLIIERSKQLRRLEVGEIIEVYEGPTVDPSVGVHRVRGCALRDGAVGWVTIAGNPGLPFLSPGGNVFKVIRPLSLFADLEDLEVSPIRPLREGEVLEVLDWARTSGSGVTRIKARARSDMAVGWATVDATGKVYLEAM